MELNENIEILECKEFTQKLREEYLKKDILKLKNDIELLHSFLDVKDITIKNLQKIIKSLEEEIQKTKL